MPIRADRRLEPVGPFVGALLPELLRSIGPQLVRATVRTLLPDLLAAIAARPIRATVLVWRRKALGTVAPQVIGTTIGPLLPELIAAIAPQFDRATVRPLLPELIDAIAPQLVRPTVLVLRRKALGTVAPQVIVTTIRPLLAELIAAIAPQPVRTPILVWRRRVLGTVAPQVIVTAIGALLSELVRAAGPELLLMATAAPVGTLAVSGLIRATVTELRLALFLSVGPRLILAIAPAGGSITQPGLFGVIRAGSLATAGLARPLTALLVGPGCGIRVSTGRLHARAAVRPAAVALEVLPLLLAEIGRGLPVRPTPLGLRGVSVSRSEHGRPNRPKVAQPVLGRRLLEIGLRPLVSGFPAEFHPCRHSATRNHHQHQDKSLRSYAVA
jgi:hypothetical protein